MATSRGATISSRSAAGCGRANAERCAHIHTNLDAGAVAGAVSPPSTDAVTRRTVRMAMTSKVMMIGLDAASVDFILASLPSLPNLRRAIENGRLSRLRSRTSELLPAASWPTLYTGVPPGVHGVYYPMQWDAAGMCLRHINGWLYAEPFWYELERQGCRVMALD